MAINPLPPAPLPSDTPQEFNEKAFAVVTALTGFINQANDLAEDVNLAAESAIDSKDQALLSKNSAEEAAAAASISEFNSASSADQARIHKEDTEAIAEYVASIGSYKLPILKNNGSSSIVTVLGSTLPVINRAGSTVSVSLTT